MAVNKPPPTLRNTRSAGDGRSVSPVSGNNTGPTGVVVSVDTGEGTGVSAGCGGGGTGVSAGGAGVLVGVGVSVAVGVLVGRGVWVGVGSNTSYRMLTGEEGHPKPSVITSVTVYVPAAPYTLAGFESVLVVPSPKSQPKV